MWYRKREWGFRLALFFSAATAAGAFGGLLARGIMEMNGVGGKAGWAWIFILEGLLTLVIAIAAYFYMTDYPAKAKFLTPEERKETTRRLTEDRTALADEYSTKFMWHAFKDWKIWVNVLITLGYVVFCFQYCGRYLTCGAIGTIRTYIVFPFSFRPSSEPLGMRMKRHSSCPCLLMW